MGDAVLGVDKIKAVLDLVISGADLGNAVSDGVGLGDLPEGIAFVKSIGPAIEAIKSGQIIPEAKDMSDEEKAQLKAYIEENANIPMVKQILDVLVDLSELIKGL